MVHTNALNSLLAVIEPVIEKLELSRVFQRSRCGGETDAVLAAVQSLFGKVPLVFHYLHTTGYR